MKKLFNEMKTELEDLLDEKVANREMKFIRRLANKKLLCYGIITIFFIVTIAVNFISNSMDGLFLLLANGEGKLSFIYNLLVPNLSYPLLYILVYLIVSAIIIKVIFNIKASFADIREGQKGTSRFATIKEVEEQYRCVDEIETEEESSNGGYEGKGGVIISRDKDKIFIDDSPNNNIIIGTTRSGKGELFVFPTIDLYSRAKEKASLVINDPKGELYGASKEILEERGYRVELLNLIVPNNSMSYNPLQLIIDAYEEGDYSTAQSLCKTLTYTLYYKAEAKDPFWQTSAMSLVNALILAVIDECFRRYKSIENRIGNLNSKCEELSKEKEKNIHWIEKIDEEIKILNKEKHKEKSKMTMYTVANMLSELGSKEDKNGINELDKYFNNLPSKSVAKMQYATSNFSKGQTRGGIFSSAMAELQIFTMDEIAKMTARNSIDLRDIGFRSDDNRPVALFMATPDYDYSNHVIASIFVRQLYYVLAKEATFNTPAECDREVIFLLDEFGNMPAIEGMASIITVCLGRKIRFNLIIQGISQLKKLYGDDYKTILGNCSNKVYIFTNEPETAEEFSKLLGDKTIVTYSRSGEILDTTKHQTESIDARRLLTTDELMHLEEGEIVIVRGTKRRDLKNNKIRPYPIFNTAEHTLKYRYEYLGDFFNNKKNLIREKINTLHEDINLEELLLFGNDEKEIREKAIKEKEIEIQVDVRDTKLSYIYTNDEIEKINFYIEMFAGKDKRVGENTTWRNFINLSKEINRDELVGYLELGNRYIEKNT